MIGCKHSLHDDRTWIQFLIEMKILQAVHTLILKHCIWKLFHSIPALKIIIMCLQVNDSIQLDLASNKVQDIIKFEVREMDFVSKENNFKH